MPRGEIGMDDQDKVPGRPLTETATPSRAKPQWTAPVLTELSIPKDTFSYTASVADAATILQQL